MDGKTSAKEGLRAHKEGLRTELRARLRALPPAARLSESRSIREQLTFPAGSKIALFAGTPSEVQLLDLLKKSGEITFYLPRVLADSGMKFLPVDQNTSLEKSPLGIMEPTGGPPATALDAIVCPGLAFTAEGGRLGQGGGFYDRALARFPSAEFIGVCFQCQLLTQLPLEEHDLKMNRIMTAHPGV